MVRFVSTEFENEEIVSLFDVLSDEAFAIFKTPAQTVGLMRATTLE